MNLKEIDMERQYVWKQLKSFRTWHFDEHSLDEVIEGLKKIKEEHNGTHLEFKICCDIEQGYDGYEFEFVVKGKRLETQEELEARIVREERASARRRKHELLQLEALKKKYEAGS